MIGTRWGVILFMLLRNDRVWQLLSDHEKKIVLENNERHNVYREDYANPELYEKGTNFDTQAKRNFEARGRELIKFLNDKNPTVVLEIGPGGGFYTNTIVNHASVKAYIGVDINPSFLEFLDPRLAEIKNEKEDFTYSLIRGDFNSISDMDIKADAIILLSTVHHIPDRNLLFRKLEKLLSNEGLIFSADPAHYIPRKMYIMRKIQKTYSFVEFYKNKNNYDTHHFCTVEEFNKINRNIKSLKISRVYLSRINFPLPALVKKVITKSLYLLKYSSVVNDKYPNTFETDNPNSLLRFFSDEMVVIFEKVSR